MVDSTWDVGQGVYTLYEVHADTLRGCVPIYGTGRGTNEAKVFGDRVKHSACVMDQAFSCYFF